MADKEQREAVDRVARYLDVRDSNLAYPFDVVADIDQGSQGHCQLLESDLRALLRPEPVQIDRDAIADIIMMQAIFQGREGDGPICSETRDDHEYLYCQNAADAVIAHLKGASK